MSHTSHPMQATIDACKRDNLTPLPSSRVLADTIERLAAEKADLLEALEKISATGGVKRGNLTSTGKRCAEIARAAIATATPRKG